MLKHLKLENVGPSSGMELEFGDRLNLITGDNGLGKSSNQRQIYASKGDNGL